MFAALHRDRGTAADLARVLAAWLVVAVLLQGFAALQALVLGPAHRHVSVEPAWPALPSSGPVVQVPVHGVAHAVAPAVGDGHAWAHQRGEAHHHAAGEAAALPADGEAALDTAACVLLAVLVPLATSLAWTPRLVRMAPVATATWPFLDRSFAPPHPPPRG